jgi:hypothetical protein
MADKLFGMIEEGVSFILTKITTTHFDAIQFERLADVADAIIQCSVLAESLTQARCNEVITDLQSLRDSLLEMPTYTPLSGRQQGRPKLDITCQQVAFFIQHGFTLVDTAKMFNCSVRTIERRLQEAGVTRRDFYSSISDEELVEVVTDLVGSNPNIGEKSIDGILKGRHIHVQRQRIRDALRLADPVGVNCRLRRALHRRVYSVFGPNHLWHVDGYHKLIRWKIVIHGGIDGYSRLVVFLKAATNNKAETAFTAFLEGVEEYGLPSRVRSDKGGENVLIADFMIQNRGSDRGSMIVGRSVHNQSIERLWRDLFSGCISSYYYLFYSMEEAGILSPDSDVDLYALRLVFLPNIQFHIDQFRHGWCCHRLRTENNRTPVQLWLSGIHPTPVTEVKFCI